MKISNYLSVEDINRYDNLARDLSEEMSSNGDELNWIIELHNSNDIYDMGSIYLKHPYGGITNDEVEKFINYIKKHIHTKEFNKDFINYIKDEP